MSGPLDRGDEFAASGPAGVPPENRVGPQDRVRPVVPCAAGEDRGHDVGA